MPLSYHDNILLIPVNPLAAVRGFPTTLLISPPPQPTRSVPSRHRKQWLDAALLYAANGWYVLPLHAFTSYDRCDCGDRKCDRREGHPWSEFWYGEASTSEEDLVSWAEMDEGARRLGIVLGPASRLVALVVDDDGEKDPLKAWTDTFGPLPQTVGYRDAGREVYLFRLPPALLASVPTRHAWTVELGDGVSAHLGTDWIPAPTSLDTSDNGRYDWIGHAAYVPLADPPPWFLWQAGLITEREYDRLVAEQPNAGCEGGPSSDGATAVATFDDPDTIDLVVHPQAGRPFVVAPDDDPLPAAHTPGLATAHDLLSLYRDAPLHVAGGWALTHALTVLIGSPKVAGTTTLLLDLARSVLTGCPFLGAPTRQAPVVLVSDQNARPLAYALRAAGLVDAGVARHLHLLTRDRIRDLDLTFEHAVEHAAQHARRVGANLIVVDSVDRLAEVDFADALSLRPIVRSLDAAASDGLAVVASVHAPTAPPDIRAVAAQYGELAAAADVFLALTPAPAQHAGDRVLSALSRFSETPPVAHLRHEGQTFRRLGPELYPLFHTAGVDVPSSRAERQSEVEASFRISSILHTAGLA